MGFARGEDLSVYTHAERGHLENTHMNNDNLIHMANQIGDFFESMPDRHEAWRTSPSTSRNSGTRACDALFLS
jgi:hypothetical protein